MNLFRSQNRVVAAPPPAFDPNDHNALLSIDAAETAGWTITGGRATSIAEGSPAGRAVPVSGTGIPISGGIFTGDDTANILIGNASPGIPTQTGAVAWVWIGKYVTIGGAKPFNMYGTSQYVRISSGGGVSIGQYSYDNGTISFASGAAANTWYAFIVQRNASKVYEAHRWNGSAWAAGTSTFEMTEDISWATGDISEFWDGDQAKLLQQYGKYFTGGDLTDLKAYLETKFA